MKRGQGSLRHWREPSPSLLRFLRLVTHLIVVHSRASHWRIVGWGVSHQRVSFLTLVSRITWGILGTIAAILVIILG